MALLGAFAVPHPPVIIPQVGKGREKEIQNTIDAYNEVGRRIAALSPETLIFISPHSVIYADYIHISPGKGASGNLSVFGAGKIAFDKKYDAEFVKALCRNAQLAGIEAGTLGERDERLDHGVMVPLYFTDQYDIKPDIMRISISGLSAITHYRFGLCIRKTAEELNRKTVIVASGDLSHRLTENGPYGYAPEGPAFDRKLTDALKVGDFFSLLSLDEAFCEAAAECGLRSFIEMAGSLDGKKVKPELLSYEGPFGVGYAVCAFVIEGDDPNRNFAERYEKEQMAALDKRRQAEDEYVRLARVSLEHYVRTGYTLQLPEGLPEELTGRRAGVFVSLKMDGRFRGCIGTTEPATRSVAQEIVRNAVSAGLHDPRFDPVIEEELPRLVYSVDVLSEAEPIASTDQLDVRRYGVIVTKGTRRGLLLPDLEGVDTPSRQVAIAKQKAGIAPEEEAELARFEVVRHH